jgi:hypothetical protein
MKNKLPLILIFLPLSHLFAQILPKNLKQAKWQQKVDYQISVELNTQNHTLNGFETINYINNSPNTLNEIYIHLWPNGYKNRNTAYAKQELEKGNTNFHFASDEERGYIDSLEFKVNGKKLDWHFLSDIDIAVIKLAEPLLSGQSIDISTPFFVKLPKVFSRLGHEDSIYCITQWYPKPAVYDVNGWNAMPYLNQGEFYSEFGKFDVSINVPKNFLVAATGLVQNEEERDWWLARTKNPKAAHPSQEARKIVHFIQDSVHDFAWFGSELFGATNSSVRLNNGKVVETWLFAKPTANNKIPKGISYVNEGVKFYSEKVGNYPYSIAQVVITPLVAGAGMEYPTITNCGSNDKTTIVHELGHNWFYGIIASNERDHPWMDESINTYYEERHRKESDTAKVVKQKSNVFTQLTNIDQTNFLFKYTSRRNADQAGNLHSDKYTDNNYGAILYAKNPLSFHYLASYLGQPKFDNMMQAYFENWKFKHPLPQDFIDHAQTFTGENLDWFFKDVLGSTQKMDYKMVKVNSQEITLQNKGDFASPVAISQIQNDTIINTRWVPGFTGKKTFSVADLQFPPSQDAKHLVYSIDREKQSIDLYPQNNAKAVRGNCESCAKLKFQPLLNLESSHAKQVFWSPVYAFNYSNRSMLGLAFYNSLIPQKKDEFVFMPVYSFGTKDINGYAQYWHNFYTQGKIKNIQLGFKSARFASNGFFYNTGDRNIQTLIADSGYGNYFGPISYEKFAPFIRFNLKPKNARSGINQAIELRYVMVNEQAADRSFAYQFMKDHYSVAELMYAYNNPNVLYPSQAKINFHKGVQIVNFNRLSAEFIQQFKISKHKSLASIRVFGGAFLFHEAEVINSKNYDVSGRAYFQGSARTSINDFLYDDAMIGRELTAGQRDVSGLGRVFSRQVLGGDAGFRNFANIGSTNTFLTALNITLPAPIPLPIGFYGDISYWQIPHSYLIVGGTAGTTQTYIPSKMQLTYNAGIYLELVRNIISLHVPLIYSNDIKGYFENNQFDTLLKRISFTINLNKLNPITQIRDIKF